MSDAGGRVILGLDPGTASTGFGVISVAGNRMRAARLRGDRDGVGAPARRALGEDIR